MCCVRWRRDSWAHHSLQIYDRRVSRCSSFPDCDTIPSTSYSLLLLLLLSSLYWIVAWYSAQTTAGPQGWLFVFSPYYWGCRKQAPSFQSGDRVAQEQQLSAEHKSIRLYKLSKAFDVRQALHRPPVREGR